MEQIRYGVKDKDDNGFMVYGYAGGSIWSQINHKTFSDLKKWILEKGLEPHDFDESLSDYLILSNIYMLIFLLEG